MDINSSLPKGQAASPDTPIPDEAIEEPLAEEEKIAIATPLQLMWWKFRKHRIAVLSVIVLGLFYTVALFADVVGPYDPNTYSASYKFIPPMAITFIDANGNFSLRPGVYGLTSERDPETLRQIWTTDTSVRSEEHTSELQSQSNLVCRLL